jgi:uncharacterized membrane protein
MQKPTRHLTRCIVAGIVALLPLGGAAFTILWLESSISGSWLREQPYYFPGLGLLLALLAIYLVGFAVSSFLGRWLWRRCDRVLESMPLLGSLYQSLKEVLGYDTGRERFFHGVVLVAGDTGDELGLVTGTCADLQGGERTLVFVPGSPNPANGRLLLLAPADVRRVEVRVGDALRALVAMGKTPLLPARE